jgi:hypothetical protein
MAAGLLFAAANPVLRYFTSFDLRSLLLGQSPWWWVQLAAILASSLCFAIACWMAVSAGLWSIGRP